MALALAGRELESLSTFCVCTCPNGTEPVLVLPQGNKGTDQSIFALADLGLSLSVRRTERHGN